MTAERRKYRRIHAPVYCRPADFPVRQRPANISMGGVRIYSEVAFEIGDVVTLEFFRADLPPLLYTAEVVWTGKGTDSTFDIGLKFIELETDAAKVLMSLLGPETETS